MQPVQPHINRPKIAKSSSSKLPDVFASARNMGSFGVGSKKNNIKHQPQLINAQKQTEQVPKKKKSKNPFLPVRQCFKMMKIFDSQLKSLQENMNFQKFSQFSLQNMDYKTMPIIKQQKYKYQNCLTLNVIKKYESGCLKKILHVPTLSIHYLKQSTIGSTDKNDLNQWILEVNKNCGTNGLRIVELFWNIPQGYYSLLYEYFQGFTISNLLQNINTLPFQIIKLIAKTHLTSHISIYNSQIILNKNNKVKYIPFYEEYLENPGGSLVKRIKERLSESQEQQDDQMESGLVSRLGIILLVCFFGQLVIQQDLNVLQQHPKLKKQCCIMHDLIKMNNSLSSLYLEQQGSQHKKFIEILCESLRYKQKQRVNFKKIFNSNFMVQINPEVTNLQEILLVLENNAQPASKFIDGKLNKLFDTIQLILQNVQQVNLKINTDNPQVILLAKQLGLVGYENRLVVMLQKAYNEWNKD